MSTVSWKINITVSGQSPISAATGDISVEATDRLQVVIDAGDSDKVVDIQPGGAAAIRVLMIKASRYGSDLSYKASDGSSDAAAVALDGPQVFTGSSAALFGLAPNQLKFSNASPDEPATVVVFVARDATP